MRSFLYLAVFFSISLLSTKTDAACSMPLNYAFKDASTVLKRGALENQQGVGDCVPNLLMCYYDFTLTVDGKPSPAGRHDCTISNSFPGGEGIVNCSSFTGPNQGVVLVKETTNFGAKVSVADAMANAYISANNDKNWNVAKGPDGKPVVRAGGAKHICRAYPAFELPDPTVEGASDENSCTAAAGIGSNVGGSVICNRDRTLSQIIPIAGTEFDMVYNSRNSSFASNAARTFSVSVPSRLNLPYDPGLAWKLESLSHNATVAGKTYNKSATPAQADSLGDVRNQVNWDGKNASGQAISGPVKASGSSGYVFSYGWFKNLGKIALSAPYNLVLGSLANLQYNKFGGWSLSHYHFYHTGSNTVYLGSGQKLIHDNKEKPKTYAVDANGYYIIPSVDGSEIYRFHASGKHFSTTDAITGVVKYSFQYNTSDNLAKITNRDGRETLIQYDAAGNLAAIVSSFGVKTSFVVDANGNITEIKDPLGRSNKFTYSSTQKGLMLTMTDPVNSQKFYTYDASGFVTSAKDRNGNLRKVAQQSIVQEGNASAVSETKFTTAMNRVTSYKTRRSGSTVTMTNTFPSGYEQTQVKDSSGLGQSVSDSVGNTWVEDFQAHPRFPERIIPKSNSVSSSASTTTTSHLESFALNNAADPFSLKSYTWTDFNNNETKATTVFDKATMTLTSTSFVGRKQVTVLNSKGRPTSSKLGNLQPILYVYNTLGQVTSAKQGTRNYSFTYDAKGNLATSTNPLNQKTSFTYDAKGNLLTTVLPNGKFIEYAYESNDNISKLFNLNRNLYTFAYDRNENHTLEVEPILGSDAFQRTSAFNGDDQITKATLPSAKALNYSYDIEGRLSKITGPSFSRTFAYESSGRLASAASNATDKVVMSGDRLPQRVAWEGAVVGEVNYSWGPHDRLTGLNVNNSVNAYFQYDEDGFPTQAGDMQITPSAATGLISATNLGSIQQKMTYSDLGEMSGLSYTNNGANLIAFVYERDALGRLTKIRTTEGAQVSERTFAYDLTGQLTSETNAGAATAYTYSANGNRSLTNGKEVYDAQDRLISNATYTYTYNKDGQVSRRTKISDNSFTNYIYDEIGNLVRVEFSNGSKVEYLTDAFNRRIRRKVNGVFKAAFIYQDSLRPAAQLDASGNVTAVFAYGTRKNSPDIMIKDGVNYRFIHDHLGSPLFVVNTSTGQVLQKLKYNSWGQVLSDSNPGFQPFGYAGGLYDSSTGLLRFGARDYDPSIGRWLSKDPIRHEGGVNLYAYVENDPLNFVDPTGLEPNDTQSMTCEAAAIKALSEVHEKSKLENREYGGWIYERNGMFRFSAPQKLGRAGGEVADNTPPNSKACGFYHTHGRENWPTDNQFSPLDLITSRSSGYDAYLSTPGKDNVMVFRPKSGKIEVLGKIRK